MKPVLLGTLGLVVICSWGSSAGATVAREGVTSSYAQTAQIFNHFYSNPYRLTSEFFDSKSRIIGVIAQASSESTESLIANYEQARDLVDKALTKWETKRPITPGFDQSLDFILASRRKALEAYFDVDYNEALRLINQALKETELVDQQEQYYFDYNLELAISAFEAEDVDNARDAIELALALRPDSEKAIDLQQEIEQLPILISARQDALAARNAGRLQDEIEALQRVLEFRPNDSEARERVESANSQLLNRNFNRAIADGHRALSNRQVAKARQALKRASELKPSDAEVSRLKQKITDTAQEIKIEGLLEKAIQSASEDDWYSVQNAFEQILKLEPQLNDAIEGRDFARSMVVRQRNLDDFLARPERLSSNKISAAAQKEISLAQPLLEFSPHMRSTVAALESELSKWQESVPVRVLSDGQTHVEVRGVGIVGVVTDRVIMLKPGSYQFEGKRKGFRNKLVDVRIRLDAEQMTEVTVICDEPA